jgi:hypothetical protein
MPYYTVKWMVAVMTLLVAVTILYDMVIIPRAMASHNKILHVLSDTTCHEVTAVLSWLLYRSFGENDCVVPYLYKQDDGMKVRTMSSLPIRLVVIIMGLRESTVECLWACGFGSLVDIDHFISARSLSLFNATHLASRPFGHAVLFVLFIFAVLRFGLRWHDLSAIYLVASLSHLVRDSSRRGLWFWPFGSTPALPYWFHLTVLCVLPYILKLLLSNRTTCPGSATPSFATDINVAEEGLGMGYRQGGINVV